MSDFENNIMPKLIKDYEENGNRKIPFDKVKIRNLARDDPPDSQHRDGMKYTYRMKWMH